jgi:hypothetical protein
MRLKHLINGWINNFNMPLTSLIIKDGDTERYLQVSTEPNPEASGVIVIFNEMNEDFTESKGSDQGIDARDDKQYHMELRLAAAIKNQLVTSHSTDPEWNPEGYIKNLDNGE